MHTCIVLTHAAPSRAEFDAPSVLYKAMKAYNQILVSNYFTTNSLCLQQKNSVTAKISVTAKSVRYTIDVKPRARKIIDFHQLEEAFEFQEDYMKLEGDIFECFGLEEASEQE